MARRTEESERRRRRSHETLVATASLLWLARAAILSTRRMLKPE